MGSCSHSLSKNLVYFLTNCVEQLHSEAWKTPGDSDGTEAPPPQENGGGGTGSFVGGRDVSVENPTVFSKRRGYIRGKVGKKRQSGCNRIAELEGGAPRNAGGKRYGREEAMKEGVQNRTAAVGN